LHWGSDTSRNCWPAATQREFAGERHSGACNTKHFCGLSYLTSTGDTPSDDLKPTLTARQIDSNVVADRAEIQVDRIDPGQTVTPGTTLTVQENDNYYLNAVLWKEGVIIATARSGSQLNRPKRCRRIQRRGSQTSRLVTSSLRRKNQETHRHREKNATDTATVSREKLVGAMFWAAFGLLGLLTAVALFNLVVVLACLVGLSLLVRLFRDPEDESGAR
jgi:hypothetical protein